MIRNFNGKTPKIAGSAFISEAAYVVGDVEIGEGSSVWPGAVIRADFAKIKIGRNNLIEDNCVIHTGVPIEIGDNNTIGHGVVIHSLKIGNNNLIGMNATVLDDVEIGDHCIIGAGSVVTVGMKIVDYSFVVGVPAEIKRQMSPEGRGRRRGPRAQGGVTYVDLTRMYKEQGL